MVKGKDIIMFGLQPWDIEIGSNFKNMAEVMRRDNRVLYVNRPLDRITYIRSRNDKKTQSRLKSIRNPGNRVIEIEKNLWVLNPSIVLESINFLPKGVVYNFFNKRNGKKIAAEIDSAVKQLGFKKDILIIDNDFFNGLYLKELIQPDFFMYYLRDFLRSQKYFEKHGAVAEPAIIRKADAVATNSLYLNSYAMKMNPKSHYVGQGCMVDEFLESGSPTPDDMKGIASPVIGYCGMLTSRRLDIELLAYLASAFPDHSLVLVGPQDEVFERSVLHGIPNVYFLGPKAPMQLPAYVHSFDVCINPQLVNQMTIGNYPRKIDEYLAAGKPVVATQTEAMMAFEDVVYLCDSKEAYVQQIEKAIRENNDAKKHERVAEAKKHTWEASVDLIYEAINANANG